MSASLNARAILITGGSRGLGREMALALAEAGARIAITGAKPSDQLDATGADLKAIAGPENVLTLVADVTDPAAAETAVNATIGAFGLIDVLVNNAGVGMRAISETFNTVPTKFWEAPPEGHAAIVDANVTGPFLMARVATPHMVAQGFGKIINISTSDMTMVRTGYAPYGPSKAYLEAASRVWAADLAGTGVDVNVLLPGGATDTDLLPTSPNKKGADGNLFPPSIMRAPIVWLASPAADAITGGRFIARLWGENGPGEARVDQGDPPAIM